jgi:hypothetical protein
MTNEEINKAIQKMKIDCNFVLHGTQLGGGLFMGIKLESPVSIYDEQIK